MLIFQKRISNTPIDAPNPRQFAIQISRYDINYRASFFLPTPFHPINTHPTPRRRNHPLELISQFRAHETFEGSSRNQLSIAPRYSYSRVPQGMINESIPLVEGKSVFLPEGKIVWIDREFMTGNTRLTSGGIN